MFAKKISILTAVLFLSSTALLGNAFAKPDPLAVQLGDRIVEGLVDHPKGAGPHPAVIIATGIDADMHDPFYEKLATAAAKDGFIAIRMDWSFRGKKAAGKPSAGMTNEAEELGVVAKDIVAARMMKPYNPDPSKVALIAKGFAAKVAMLPETGATSEKIKGLLVLDPGCDPAPATFAVTYAPLLAAKSSRMIVASRSGACPLSQIYAAAKDFGDSISLFAGDTSPEATLAVIDLWLQNLGWVAPDAAKKAKTPDLKKHEAQSAGTHP
jgi:dienelactone hydrolase